jgi:hypothetical protein
VTFATWYPKAARGAPCGPKLVDDLVENVLELTPIYASYKESRAAPPLQAGVSWTAPSDTVARCRRAPRRERHHEVLSELGHQGHSQTMCTIAPVGSSHKRRRIGDRPHRASMSSFR